MPPLILPACQAPVRSVALQMYATTSRNRAFNPSQTRNLPLGSAATTRSKGALPWYQAFAGLTRGPSPSWETPQVAPAAPSSLPTIPAAVRVPDPAIPSTLSVLAPLRAGLAQIAAAGLAGGLAGGPRSIRNVDASPGLVTAPAPATPPATADPAAARPPRRDSASFHAAWARLNTPIGWDQWKAGMSRRGTAPVASSSAAPTATATPAAPAAPASAQATVDFSAVRAAWQARDTAATGRPPIATVAPMVRHGADAVAFLTSYDRHMALREAHGGIWLGGFFDDAKADLDQTGALPSYATMPPPVTGDMPRPSAELLHSMHSKRTQVPPPPKLEHDLRRQIPKPSVDLPFPQQRYPCRPQKSELHPYALNRALDQALGRVRG